MSQFFTLVGQSMLLLLLLLLLQSCFSRVWLFAIPWTAACQASLSMTNSQSLCKLMSIESVMPFVIPFSSCLQSFPALGSFPVSQLFTSGGQSTGASASASVLPMSTHNWFPLGLTDLISLQAKALSRVFSELKSINLSLSIFLLLLFSPCDMSDSLLPHGLKHVRLLYPPQYPRVCLNSCPLSQ